MTPTSDTLGHFVAELDDRIPATTRRRAAFHALDSIGVALAASTFDFGPMSAAALASLEQGPVPVIGLPQRLTVRDAALMAGMLVHGIDFDDTAIYGRVHPSAFCLPGPLALGKAAGTSGATALTAYIAGLECSIRLGAVAEGGFQRRGFHPTGVIGAFGGAFAAAKALGLDAAQIASAQGIVYSAAAGNRSYSADMAWTKRFQPGWGAVSGITAAVLAKGGFVGPRLTYEGEFGLYAVYLEAQDDRYDLSRATSDLGERWLVEEIAVKPIAACYFNIPLIDAALRIAAQGRPRAAEIERVEALVPLAAVDAVCEPVAAKRRPGDAYAAEFSAFYVVAASLLRGKFDLGDLQPAALADPAVLALAQKVDYAVDPHTDFPKHYTGALKVWMRNGETFEAREDVDRGSPERPLPDDEVVAKFETNAGRVFRHAHVERLRDMILGIDRLPEVGTLVDLLSTAGDGARNML